MGCPCPAAVTMKSGSLGSRFFVHRPLAGSGVSAWRADQAFLAQALHQPPPATCLTPNSGQPAKASVALP